MVRSRPQANPQNAGTLTSTTTQYDSLGREANVSYNDGLTATKYFYYDTSPSGLNWSTTPSNTKGRLAATQTNAWGNTRSQYSYDAAGNVTTLWQCAPSICNSSAQSSRVISLGYDLAGGLRYENDPTSGALTYARSPAGEVTSISTTSWDGAGNTPSSPYMLVSNVANGPFGPTNWALGNGTTSVRSYDSMGRNNGGWLCPGTGAQSQAAYCSGTATNNAQLYGFSLTTSGSRVSVMCDTVIQCQNHGYDDFDRLTSVNSSGSAGTYSYSYDRWGNRLMQTYNNGVPASTTWSYNASNQIVSSSNTSVPQYDAAGNETQDEAGNTYTYDAEGKILTVGGSNTASYTYDALDQRAQVTNSGGTVEYLYDPFGRRTSTWNTAANFGIHGRILWDGMQIAWRGYQGQTMYEHQDWLGTERMRTNYQGQTIAALHSLAFGEGSYADQVSGGGAEENNQFTSQEHDSESGTEHFKYRQYSSVQGRWMSPDSYNGSYSASNPQSLNRYAYVLNNPFSAIDPDGHSCQYGYVAGNAPPAPPGSAPDSDNGYVLVVSDDGDGRGCAAAGVEPSGNDAPGYSYSYDVNGDPWPATDKYTGILAYSDLVTFIETLQSSGFDYHYADDVLAAAGLSKHEGLNFRSNSENCSIHLTVDANSGQNGAPVRGTFHFDLYNPFTASTIMQGTRWDDLNIPYGNKPVHGLIDVLPDILGGNSPGGWTGNHLCP